MIKEGQTLCLIFSGHVFRFITEDSLNVFLDEIFNASTNRSALYKEVMISTTEEMLHYILQETIEAPAEFMMGAAILSKKYGQVYDPECKLFKIEDPEKYLVRGDQ